ncbi:hypothetical protein HDIA_2054 [Hartmannibacter diazotrophicus]|uniref:DUF3126 domain-containing protein n=1 Tax=Hartmannibacter diazotrophicus TaxID=1482074 RepID=A0A2C9D7S7_9HYPH|nr:DUF3126 family protein [Hartmannibacter diazotrophicus]SON55595.1 hypothetical protein HDIA_2054 [Hartmannibacter diazotrophicus]
MTSEELQKIENFLRRTFNSPTISVRMRPKKDDSAEVYVGEEFIGIVFKDEEDGDYNFNMAILDVDLED